MDNSEFQLVKMALNLRRKRQWIKLCSVFLVAVVLCSLKYAGVLIFRRSRYIAREGSDVSIRSPTLRFSSENGGTGRYLVREAGHVWPKPRQQVSTADVFVLRRGTFNFTYAPGSQHCEILDLAFERYTEIIFSIGEAATSRRCDADTTCPRELNVLVVSIKEPCEGASPHLDSKENYELTVSREGVKLKADSVWGALRGLETFSQLIYRGEHDLYTVNRTDIQDFPRFPHRGVLLDTSRHFVPVKYILQNLDAMAFNKFNVFHWHIVDDPSFPYESVTFPELSKKGAFHPDTHVYTQKDVRTILEYARLRGIRVMPEFDTPGHTLSWRHGQPGLLTTCYTKSGKHRGAFNPVHEDTYQFMGKLLKELKDVFPDQLVHLGGDEVNFNCWNNHTDIAKFMEKQGFHYYAKLQSYYIQRMIQIVESLGKESAVWEDVICSGSNNDPSFHCQPEGSVPKNTVIQVWKRGNWAGKMAQVTQRGLRTILSACWYLDLISLGEDWPPYYRCDPHAFSGTKAQKDLVLGGEACLWGEFVDWTNLLSRLWPRASVIAERLWSSEDTTDMDDASVRLGEHRCRMVRRGIPAQPLHPSACPFVPV
ncbi:PREDICTED: LOW QUALITY PROTEIN: beta-hexosaminidase subunit alpha-like [Branchiostoma belcheri]|uniref:Beta-hexosaminidase n=1 Tax=Branchiostoma belcheri TaxID=7741 RepID=A0A6P5A0H5_BRABE|nr:PREDICTED: LOW QUALITY PROTEIN: beta-hexosaminidase subunit alpha-like [Branchiostoma belcheri]